jgi:DNA mismatch endonuclease (patch repair protein)
MSREKRKAFMSRIRGRNTGVELAFFRALRRAGVHFRRHVRLLQGCTPDAIVEDGRVAVFVDGDFWHGWRFPAWSAKLQPFWRRKIGGNRARDSRNHRALRRRGWVVVRIWEHQIERDLTAAIERITRLLTCRASSGGRASRRVGRGQEAAGHVMTG